MTEVVIVCCVCHAASHELNFTMLTLVSTQFAYFMYFSLLRILELVGNAFGEGHLKNTQLSSYKSTLVKKITRAKGNI